MGAIFSRIKTWSSTEDLTNEDLNAEFDNILTNLVPLQLDDYSVNTTQMQVTSDPGEVGTESLATTLAGEIARLRFLIKEITGEDQWYESPVASLTGLANAVGTGSTNNRIVSGRVRTNSQQPIFLVPNGAARTVKLDGTPVNFIYYVNGTEYTISTDVTLTNLTAAPSSNNTCLVNDTIAADQNWTKHTGENGTEIPVDTMGSEITALVGKYAAFALNNGSATEYFIAYVASSTSLTKARRGYFFDSADAPVPRVVYANNDTITLLKLSWIFAKTDGTLEVGYTNPTYGKDEPSSPATGDFHFDTDSQTWKKYSGTEFVASNSTLVGVCAQDTTNTVAARSFEFFLNYTEDSTLELIFDSNTQVKTRFPGIANVWGTVIKNEHNLFTWDMTLDLDSGVVENSSTYYYFYLTEEGDKIISDIRPYDRRNDLRGYYHPHQSWRCLGVAFNNGSSNLSAVHSFHKNFATGIELYPPQTAALRLEPNQKLVPVSTSGGAFTVTLPPAALWKDSEITVIKTSTDVNLCTVDGYEAETINGGTNDTIFGQYESATYFSTGTEVFVIKRTNGLPIDYTPTFTGFGTVNTESCDAYRVGAELFLRVRFVVGTSTATEARVSLPGGLTSSSIYTTVEQVGMYGRHASGGTTDKGGFILIEPSVAYVTFGDDGTLDSDSVEVLTKANGNAMSSSGNILSFNARIRISGWNG